MASYNGDGPMDKTEKSLNEKLQAVAAALKIMDSVEIQQILATLLVDLLSGHSAQCTVEMENERLCSLIGEKIQVTLEEQLISLITVHKTLRESIFFDVAKHVLSIMSSYIFGQSHGLERARLLEILWKEIPHSMKAYGYLRAVYLDGGLDEVFSEYLDWQILEKDIHAWIFFARGMSRTGKTDEALNILTLLKERDPENPFVSELLANVLIDCKDFETADALYVGISDQYCWPAGSIRLSDSFIGGGYDQQFDYEPCFSDFNMYHFAMPESYFHAGYQLFVISVDDRYAQRYLAGILRSLGEVYKDDLWLLHVHLINPSEETLETVFSYQASNIPLAASVEHIELRTDEIDDTRKITQMRTYYACARFRLLPFLFQFYCIPMWIIDVDMLVKRPLNDLFKKTGIQAENIDIGIVFNERARCLTEYIGAALSYYQPSETTENFARTLARYLDFHLDRGHWGWGLDQAAFFAVLEWFKRNRSGIKIGHFPSALICGGDEAVFQNFVGSVNF
jgi:hypothetical protein